MNDVKAREFFSAYHEGSLDNGLRQSLERKLNADPALRADYESFVALMQDLGRLKEREIQEPPDLFETISARLDKHIYETRHEAKWSLIERWRSIALGAAALTAIVAAVWSIRMGNGDFSTAGVAPPTGTGRPEVVVRDGQAFLQFKSNEFEQLILRSGIDGEVLQRFSLQRQELRSPLTNGSEKAALLSVDRAGDDASLLMAIPGKKKLTARNGEGTVVDFALAAADFYRMPVEVTASIPTQKVKWQFAPEPVRTTTEPKLTVEERSTGILSVAAN